MLPIILLGEHLLPCSRVYGIETSKASRGWKIGRGVPSEPTRGFGEHCELPQWGLGVAPAANEWWVVVAITGS